MMLQVDDFDEVRDLMAKPLEAVGVELTHLKAYLDPKMGNYTLDFRFSVNGNVYVYACTVSGLVFHKPLTELAVFRGASPRHYREDQAMVRNMAAMLSDAILYDCRRY